MAKVLGWSRDYITTVKQDIDARKHTAAQQVIDTMRVQAAELARPKFETMTKTELAEYAAKFSVSIKKSAKKGELVEALAANVAAAENIVGLTKRLVG